LAKYLAKDTEITKILRISGKG